MKTTGWRSLILYIIGAGFLVGIIFFICSYFIQGGSWAIRPSNAHITNNGQLTYSGEITDRDSNLLSYSKDGVQQYNDNALIRKATLHVVGDPNGYISTGAQYAFRTQLSGFNPITGVVSPFGSSVTGSNIKLTISSDVSAAALQALNGKKGAVAVYNYKTGEVLCMVSSPTFDPLNIPSDIETNSAYEGVYLNNALSSTYTPGSIFKVITAAAAIENIPDLDSRTFHCSGSTIINGEKITCDSVHGDISFQNGLAQSCNVVFAELAVELGKDTMTKYADQLGCNTNVYLDGNPNKMSSYNVEQADDNSLAWSGIGQYTDTVNPYHMMILMGAIANGGTPVNPYIIQSVTNSIGLQTKTGKTSNGDNMLKQSTAEELQRLMRYTVSNYYGDSMFPNLQVAAKTGTAEVGDNKIPTGWIVGYSERDDLPLAFAVVVEEGNYGRNSAGVVANTVLQKAAALYT